MRTETESSRERFWDSFYKVLRNLAAKKKELGEKNLAEANAKAKQTVDDANAKAAEIHTIMMQQTERE